MTVELRYFEIFNFIFAIFVLFLASGENPRLINRMCFGKLLFVNDVEG